jgi:putative ABC transport system substrate-binding protein
MRRRAVIAGFVGAAALPPIVRAQQPPMPAIGFLDSRFPDALGDRLRGFRLGLKLAGYAEGENVAVVYRFAENQAERLPALASELVRRPSR